MKFQFYSKEDLKKINISDEDINMLSYKLKIPYIVKGLLLEIHDSKEDIDNLSSKKIVKLDNKVVVIDHYLWEALLRDQSNLFLYSDKDFNVYYWKENINQFNNEKKQYSISKIIGFKPIQNISKDTKIELKEEEVRDSILSIDELNKVLNIRNHDDIKKYKDILDKLYTTENEDKKKENEKISIEKLEKYRGINKYDNQIISIMLKSPKLNLDSVLGIVYDKDKVSKNNNKLRHGLNKILISDGKVIHYYKKDNMVDDILK